MTGRDDVTGQATQFSRGLWGGLVLLDQHPLINVLTMFVEQLLVKK